MSDAAALDGVKVLDLTWVVAGPNIARCLADFGATVVHVETSKRIETGRLVGPYHDGKPGLEQSVLYGNMNAGKLGITLDLTQPAGREVALDLVDWADVVIEGYAPGVMARWGLAPKDLVGRRPDLIMLSTSLLGQSGRYAQYAGYGPTGAAMAGFQYIGGAPDRPPLGPPGPYTDYVSPRFAALAILAALDHRRRTGEGAYFDHSQVEAAIHFLAPAVVDYSRTGHVLQRAANRDRDMAPHGVYPCEARDGRRQEWVAVAVRDDDDWHRFAAVLGDSRLHDARFASALDRLAATDELDEIVGEWTRQRSAPEVEQLFQASGIPAHIAASSRDALDDPQLSFRGHFVELPHEVHGTTWVEGARMKLSATPGAPRAAAPTMGQHNEYVLRELLAYDDERMVELYVEGILE